ncbi:MAPK protein hog1 [Rhizophlyctis rosea]|nr:MAPK protein hog1 [Rhizophlyctis rosea]
MAGADFQRYSVFGTIFEVTQRYTDLQPVGMGAFGLVCSAKDQLTGMNVAIKKIMKPFSTPVLAKRTYRELKLLKHLKHDNVISLSDIFISPLEDIYFVTELLGTDLHRLLTSRPLDKQFVQYFLYQILRGLKYVHSAGVVHRDLKPSNILVNENCDLKICDFGLARITESQMTGYVSTRYYRAPEIMLTWQKYDEAVDIWSVGCIFAEMIDGKPLFPGKDHVNQFSIITELLGTPPDDVIQTICSENTLRFVQSLPRREKIPFTKRFPNADPMAVDILEKMLVFDPRKRINAEQALAHPYLAPYHDPSDEPVAESVFDWSFTEADLSVEEWKERIYQEVLDFHSLDAGVGVSALTPIFHYMIHLRKYYKTHIVRNIARKVTAGPSSRVRMDFHTLASTFRQVLLSLSTDMSVEERVRSLAGELLVEDDGLPPLKFQKEDKGVADERTSPISARAVASDSSAGTEHPHVFQDHFEIAVTESPPPFGGVSSPDYFSYGVAQRPYYLPVLQIVLLWAKEKRYPFTDAHARCVKVVEEVGDLKERLQDLSSLISSLTSTVTSHPDPTLSALSSAFKTFLTSLTIPQVLLLLGHRLTTGSAQDTLPPSLPHCIQAFVQKHPRDNSKGDGEKLTVGAKALSKHCHRDGTDRWWGDVTGTVSAKNRHAVNVLARIFANAGWMNIHSLPHNTRVYEVRTMQGYGARWYITDLPPDTESETTSEEKKKKKTHTLGAKIPISPTRTLEFRGFLEPPMEGGHDVGWRH